VWSFGILIIELLTGNLPFDHEQDPMEISNMIIQGEIKIPAGHRDNIDSVTKMLLAGIF